jgi:hypothetical protein
MDLRVFLPPRIAAISALIATLDATLDRFNRSDLFAAGTNNWRDVRS